MTHRENGNRMYKSRNSVFSKCNGVFPAIKATVKIVEVVQCIVVLFLMGIALRQSQPARGESPFGRGKGS